MMDAFDEIPCGEDLGEMALTVMDLESAARHLRRLADHAAMRRQRLRSADDGERAPPTRDAMLLAAEALETTAAVIRCARDPEVFSR
jgi:hypothetical protein